MDATQRIALAIMQGRGANPAAFNPPLAQAPPPVGPADFAQAAMPPAQGDAMPPQAMPPVTAAASPLPPQGDAMPPAAPPEMPPSLAVPPSQAAPTMVRMPSTDLQLQDWRKLMDAMQFARQGQ